VAMLATGPHSGSPKSDGGSPWANPADGGFAVGAPPSLSPLPRHPGLVPGSTMPQLPRPTPNAIRAAK